MRLRGGGNLWRRPHHVNGAIDDVGAEVVRVGTPDPGQDQIAVYPSSDEGRRPFCKTCGSVAPMVMEAAGLAIVPAGNLDGDPGVGPPVHMFGASRAPLFPKRVRRASAMPFVGFPTR